MATLVKVTSDLEDPVDESLAQTEQKIQKKNKITLKRKFKEVSSDSNNSSDESDMDHNIIEDDEDEEVPVAKNKIASAMQEILSATGKNKILVPSKKKKTVEPILLPRKRIWKDKFRKKILDGSDIGYERRLRTIATVGVVQLFASIETHRKSLMKDIEVSKGEFARERTLRAYGEETFKQILDEQLDKPVQHVETVDKEKSENNRNGVSQNTGWDVLSKHLISESTNGGWDEQSSGDSS